MSDGTYESIQQHRAALGELAAREAAIVSALKVPTHIELVDALRARIVSDTFTILVLGDFKNGKSTFINALLGEKVLPSFARPATAIVNACTSAGRRRPDRPGHDPDRRAGASRHHRRPESRQAEPIRAGRGLLAT